MRSEVAAGTSHPLFTFVPFGNIVLAPPSDLQAWAACDRGGLPFALCDSTPKVLRYGGLSDLGRNWSQNASTNVI